ncbi:MAG: PLD nuclease N-terminal domain-containing protein [Cyclobacteriaceae bacterium]
MAKLISLIILIIDIVVIFDIVKSRKDTEKKILWIVAVIFLPVLGPVLYYFLGKNKEVS